MKKIDNWLSIQRYVSEAAHMTPVATFTNTNVEVWGKVRSPRADRKTRRFLVPRITHI
jgi:hypothetical protein